MATVTLVVSIDGTSVRARAGHVGLSAVAADPVVEKRVSIVGSLIVASLGNGGKVYQAPRGGFLATLWPGRERERVRPRGAVVMEVEVGVERGIIVLRVVCCE